MPVIPPAAPTSPPRSGSPPAPARARNTPPQQAGSVAHRGHQARNSRPPSGSGCRGRNSPIRPTVRTNACGRPARCSCSYPRYTTSVIVTWDSSSASRATVAVRSTSPGSGEPPGKLNRVPVSCTNTRPASSSSQPYTCATGTPSGTGCGHYANPTSTVCITVAERNHSRPWEGTLVNPSDQDEQLSDLAALVEQRNCLGLHLRIYSHVAEGMQADAAALVALLMTQP